MRNVLRGSVFCLIVGFVLPAYSSVLYSTGFENPPFTTGEVAGQNGWQVFGTSDAAQVESGVSESGSQAVTVIPALASDQTGPYYALTTSATEIDISADLMIDSSSNQSEWQFGALAPGLFPFAGGFNVLPDGDISLISSGHPDVGAFTYNSWNLVNLLLNFDTQTFDLSINGALLASNAPFCGDNSVCAGATVSSFGDFLFDAFPATGANDIAYLDNVTISSVPEPQLEMLLGMGLAGLVARRVKRR